MTSSTTETPQLAIIVEDDEQLAEIYSAALAEAGFATEMVEAGDMALARILAKAPTLVLLDLHLPYLSGDEVLAQIRSHDRLSHTQVVLATADLVLAEKLKGVADRVLIKPVTYQQLYELGVELQGA